MEKNLHALYLHIPFCVKKCSYCDFYSLPPFEPDLMQKYSLCLAGQIRSWGQYFSGSAQIDSIYIGGGTPSLLSESAMGVVLEAVAQAWNLAPDIEISMEANPATLPAEKIQSFCASGVNRISLGVQSFIPQELKTLGRLHGVREVLETVDCIRDAGISNYNLDLIYGVPGQTMETWESSLQQVLDCGPAHLSMYLLQMDEHVPLYRQIERGEKIEPDESSVVEMFYRGDEILQEHGFNHYEISNFALHHKECRHNLHYWKSHPYLGLGAGAVSFLEGKRFRLASDIRQFFTSECCPGQEWGDILESMKTPEELLGDAMVMGLRCMKGVSRMEFKKRFGIDIDVMYADEFAECEKNGLLECCGQWRRLTKKGWFLSNQVLWHFV